MIEPHCWSTTPASSFDAQIGLVKVACPFQVVFEGVWGNNRANGFIGVDDVTFFEGDCDSKPIFPSSSLTFFRSSLFPHITLILVFASQMVLLGFFCDSSLFASPMPSWSHWSMWQKGIVRERESAHRGDRKKKEEEEIPTEKKHFSVTGIQTHGLCLQTWPLEPLDHCTLPSSNLTK